MHFLDASNFNDFDHVLGRLQGLTIPSCAMSSLTPPSPLNLCSDFSKSYCTLDAPFIMSHACKQPGDDDGPTIIDTFAPRPLSFDLSPTSSVGSDFESLSSHSSLPHSSFDAFVATRSRVVRVCDIPAYPAFLLTRSSLISSIIYLLPPSQFYLQCFSRKVYVYHSSFRAKHD